MEVIEEELNKGRINCIKNEEKRKQGYLDKNEEDMVIIINDIKNISNKVSTTEYDTIEEIIRKVMKEMDKSNEDEIINKDEIEKIKKIRRYLKNEKAIRKLIWNIEEIERENKDEIKEIKEKINILEKEIEEDKKEIMNEEEFKKALHKKVNIAIIPKYYKDMDKDIRMLVRDILHWYIGGEYYLTLMKEKEGIKYMKICDTDFLGNIYIEYSFE